MADVPMLCFDGDSAGQKAAIRAAHRALPHARARPLASPSSRCPPGQDPDDLVRARRPRRVRGAARRARSRWSTGSGRTNSPPSRSPRPRRAPGSSARLIELAATIGDADVRERISRRVPPPLRRAVRPRPPQRQFQREPRKRPQRGAASRRLAPSPRTRAVRPRGDRPDPRQGGAGRPDPPSRRDRAPCRGARGTSLGRWRARRDCSMRVDRRRARAIRRLIVSASSPYCAVRLRCGRERAAAGRQTCLFLHPEGADPRRAREDLAEAIA